MVELEPETEGSMQISGRARFLLWHQRPLAAQPYRPFTKLIGSVLTVRLPVSKVRSRLSCPQSQWASEPGLCLSVTLENMGLLVVTNAVALSRTLLATFQDKINTGLNRNS
ncbi:hypothetical protein PoB_006284500 [Plakobranchus ocellatus]|uniref:Uncharacterized protein n=1 Tax=Plakobranchus ocellatus TaxID=259542 RepID=A0AAV4CWT0_9GAST|nr:hypothetical protein PoB_006284500 [Plakobranchus ocellatus]